MLVYNIYTHFWYSFFLYFCSRKKYPDVSQHMTNLEMPWALIITKWFICLFAEVLPIEVINDVLNYV